MSQTVRPLTWVVALSAVFLTTVCDAAADSASIERGRYLAVAGDCTACHTKPGGQPFAGGLPINTPIGAVYSTNITPDSATGIGAYSLSDFERAVRQGITPHRGTLYPAMPYPSYARTTDADIQSLYSYFMHGVPPVQIANRAPQIHWPLSLRWPLAIWRKLFAPSKLGFDVSRYQDPGVARGAYLVQGPGHCGACHTPRAITLQEKALDESGDSYLAGGRIIDGWLAVNLRGNPADGLGSWTQQDIVDTLRSARNPTRAVIGAAMSDVVVHSTQYLTVDDQTAIAAYLKTLPRTTTTTSSFAPDPATARKLAAGVEMNRGAQLYLDNCAACHRSNGEGNARVFPSLTGNSSVLAADPASIIRLMLQGGAMPATRTAPSNLGMPAFAWRLSDAEIAQLGTFIRSSWGNRAPGVSETQVSRIRRSLGAPQP